MEEIRKQLSIFLDLAVALNNHEFDIQYPILKLEQILSTINIDREPGELFPVNTLGERNIIYAIEKMLIETDDNGRRFIFRRIFSEYRQIFECAALSEDIGHAVLNNWKEFNDVLRDFYLYVDSAIRFIADYVCIFCESFNFNSEELAEHFNYDKNSKYKVFPATYRRAAVMALIEASGLCKDIDKTKKAAFVEAVTGGNIEADPKDTVSYKIPEQNAKNAATKLLQETLRIEAKWK